MSNYEMSSNVIEFSESKTYIELTRRLCYYDYPNLNNVQLNSDNAEEKAQTLLMQPVVAKYKKFNNKDDLGGHECSVDSKGNVTFGTIPIGVNVSVEIKKDTVNINGENIETPCLFATSRIWKRNKNVCSAIKRLFAEGKLHSSWEIITSEAKFDGDIKILTDYTFEADALLGSSSRPAYGECATTLCVASNDDSEILLSEAIADDFNIINSTIKEEEGLNTENKENVVVSEDKTDDIVDTSETTSETENAESVDTGTDGSNETEDETVTTEVSALTSNDLRSKITKLCRAKIPYCWVAFMFPVEKYVLVESDNRESELDYLKVAYDVNGDEVTIGEPEPVRLVTSVANINSEIASKNDAIIKANNEIANLKAEINTLSQYRDMFERAEKEKAEKELSEKKESLRKYAIKSGYISDDEIETSEEIKKLIDTVDENGIKAIIVDRLMANKNETVVSEVSIVETETASLTCDDTEVSYKSIMNKFLGK